MSSYSALKLESTRRSSRRARGERGDQPRRVGDARQQDADAVGAVALDAGVLDAELLGAAGDDLARALEHGAEPLAEAVVGRRQPDQAVGLDQHGGPVARHGGERRDRLRRVGGVAQAQFDCAVADAEAAVADARLAHQAAGIVAQVIEQRGAKVLGVGAHRQAGAAEPRQRGGRRLAAIERAYEAGEHPPPAGGRGRGGLLRREGRDLAARRRTILGAHGGQVDKQEQAGGGCGKDAAHAC